ncbi:flagellar hook-length control protein FliK [Ureibacillus thermophilus]|uniref:flagellar hook-length control protein FliK n=1 Tax=Ureibacillus thermophilus TaxID=367743 RepID=UPI00361B4643
MNIGAFSFAIHQLPSISAGKLNQPSNKGDSKFGNIFSSMVANNTKEVDVQRTAEVQELLEENSFEGVLELLGISYDEGLFIVSQGEEEKAVSIDEVLENLDNLLSLLNINREQLNEILQLILGQEVSINNLSDFIQFINEQPQLSADIALTILGKDKDNQKVAVQLLQLMKLVEIICKEYSNSQQSSLLLSENNNEFKLQRKQPANIFQTVDKVSENEQSTKPISGVKAVLQNVENLISIEGTSSSGKFSLEGFEQVVQQVKTTMENSASTLPNTMLQPNSETKTVEGTSSSGKFSLEGFEQVVQQAKTRMENSASTLPNTMLQPNSETKTVTITLPNTNQTSQAESLVKQIEALLQRSQMANTQGTSKILIKLHPENLGSIRIELVHREGAITARLLASTSQAKELLDSQVHQLKQAFVQQNIQLERIDILQSLQESDLREQSFFNNMFNGRERQEKEEQHSEEKQEEESKSFKDYLIDEEV